MVFDPPMHRCKICKQARKDQELAVVKMADVQEALAYKKPLPHSYSGNVTEIRYCRDDMACGRGARETAGDLLIE